MAKPHSVDNQTDERVNQFIMRNFGRNVIEYKPIPSKAPELARNSAIDEFLNDPRWSKKTHLFFLDADTCPADQFAIDRLLGHKKEVVAGVTPIFRSNATGNGFICYWNAMVENPEHKGGGKFYCLKCKNSFDNPIVAESSNPILEPGCPKCHSSKLEKPFLNIGIDELPMGLFKAGRVGGTTVLVSRQCLEKLEKPYQKVTYNDDCTDVTLSEDVYFCDNIRKAGFDIWVDPVVMCNHYHNFNLLDLFALYMQTKARFQVKEAAEEENG